MTSVNSYRRKTGLASIPTNNCLCKTANAHTKELNADLAQKQSWKECRYHARNYQCMWNKPKEICGYPNKGYENWAWSTRSMTATLAINQWKRLSGTNQVMLNGGQWRKIQFKGMGASVEGNHGVLWFGD
jgi:hypothetical protein